MIISNSSFHDAVAFEQGGALYIRDVGSTFGTYLNDKRLSEPKRASDAYKLKPCDSIKVGQTSLRWRPIESIESAVAAFVPRALPYPSDQLEAQLATLQLPAELVAYVGSDEESGIALVSRTFLDVPNVLLHSPHSVVQSTTEVHHGQNPRRRSVR